MVKNSKILIIMPPIDLVKTERGCGTGNGIRKRKPETEFGNGNRKRKRKRTSVPCAFPGCSARKN